MYSSRELAQELALKRVADAIDELDASFRAADPAELEARIAAVWAMVGALDPNLAKLASRYAKGCDWRG
ncbi:MAG: hypothetical protein JO345_29750 [Streptosporangiaceae bacterium]|nr:hypothetical protein [Streptosporangiaceae bacterium]